MKKTNQKVLLYVLLGILVAGIIGVAIYYGSGSTMQGSLRNVIKAEKKIKDTSITVAPVVVAPVGVASEANKASYTFNPVGNINTVLAPIDAAAPAAVKIDLPAGSIKYSTTTDTTRKD